MSPVDALQILQVLEGKKLVPKVLANHLQT